LKGIISWVGALAFVCHAQAAELRYPEVNGMQFNFTLDCETNGIYLIEQSTNLVDWRVVARNAELTTNRFVSCSNNFPGGEHYAFVRARRTNEPLFQFVMAAKRGITMNGLNLRTDSFDSATNSSYNDGYRHYTNSPGKWKTGGDIASNDSITNILSGNAYIFGRVATGPFGAVNIGSSGMIGDEAWQSDPSHYGTIQPGRFTEDTNIDFPSVMVPATNASWQAVSNSPTVLTNGEFFDITLAGGALGADYYMAGTQALRGKIYVSGNVRLLVQTKINLAGTDRIKLAPGAKLQLFADCAIASLGGNGVQNFGTAADFSCFGTDRNIRLAYGGNASFTGVFYAPAAEMTLSGGVAGSWTLAGP
jgi:hypothetical protein